LSLPLATVGLGTSSSSPGKEEATVSKGVSRRHSSALSSLAGFADDASSSSGISSWRLEKRRRRKWQSPGILRRVGHFSCLSTVLEEESRERDGNFRGRRRRRPAAGKLLVGVVVVALLWPCTGLLFCLFNLDRWNFQQKHGQQQQTQYLVSLPDRAVPVSVLLPPPTATSMRARRRTANFGGLEIISGNQTTTSKAAVFARSIRADDRDRYNLFKAGQIEETDLWLSDEDVPPKEPDRFDHYDELDWGRLPPHKEDGRRTCRRPNKLVEALVQPACNTFHEVSLSTAVVSSSDDRRNSFAEEEARYVAHGYYRDVWMLTTATASTNATTNVFAGAVDDGNREPGTTSNVLKTNRIHEFRNFRPYDYSQTQMEALTMLRGSSSNLIMDIYGYCGATMLVEPGTPIEEEIVPQGWVWVKQRGLDKIQIDDVKPLNNYTAEQKLDLAIRMAEGLALLHGDPYGVMISHDLGFDQWLRSQKDGLVKMNDMNKVRALQWDPDSNGYCRVWSHQYGSYRAPEEINGGFIDESSDVNTLGKLLYTVLTGLRTYYDELESGKANRAVLNGKLPYIDPRYRTRSFIEGRLAEIMEQCWVYRRKDRVSIFDVVAHLRETKRLHDQQSATAKRAIS